LTFAVQEWLFLLLALPVLFLVLRGTDRKAAKRLANMLGKRSNEHIERLNPRLRQWRRFLLFAGLFWLIIAMARPQWGASEVVVSQKGTDLVIALDISNSMLAEDVAPNRISSAKAELGSFLAHLEQSRVGIVLFAGSAFVQCPLTMDYGTAELFLRMADPDMLSEQGTAIAAALSTSRELLIQGSSPGGDAFRVPELVRYSNYQSIKLSSYYRQSIDVIDSQQ